jgi:hypothetical protein
MGRCAAGVVRSGAPGLGKGVMEPLFGEAAGGGDGGEEAGQEGGPAVPSHPPGAVGEAVWAGGGGGGAGAHGVNNFLWCDDGGAGSLGKCGNY